MNEEELLAILYKYQDELQRTGGEENREPLLAAIAEINAQLDEVQGVTIDAESLTEDAALAGESASISAIEGFGETTLSADIDEAGLVADAESAGTAASAALIKAFGSPQLTAQTVYGAGHGMNVGGVGVKTREKYAEGGRATVASIFGEAGPEWAIPEEHSERTANLLNLARQASGFTWGELISRYGGLNASPNNHPIQLTYAPTIHASDASGIASVLSGDKDKLMRMIRAMLEEINMRNDAEVYA